MEPEPSQLLLDEWSTYLSSPNNHSNNFQLLMQYNDISSEYSKFVSGTQKPLAFWNKIFLLVLLFILNCSYVLTTLQEYRLSLTVAEGITILGSLFIFILQQFIKRVEQWKYLSLLWGWLLFLLLSACSIVVMWEIYQNSCSPASAKFLIKKFFFNMILSNLSACYFLRINLTMNFRHLIGIGIMDIIMIIIYSVSWSCFYESLLLAYLFLYILITACKNESVNKTFFDKFLDKKLQLFQAKRIQEGAGVGYCVITDQFEIKHINEYFKENLSHLVSAGCQRSHSFDGKDVVTFTKKMGGSSLIYNDESHLMKTSGLGLLTSKFGNVETKYESRMVSKQSNRKNECAVFLEVDELYQKSPVSNPGDSGKSAQKLKLRKAILAQIEQCKQPGTCKKFIKLGRFKMNDKDKGTNHFYDVLFMKKPHYNNSLSSNETFDYEIIFIEQTGATIQEKLLIEQKYKNLLLKKISHEFKAPIMIIQNIVDGILNEAFIGSTPRIKGSNINIISHKALNMIMTENEHKETNSNNNNFPYAYYQHESNCLQISCENLNKIKFLSEVILLMVEDISEYIFLKSEECENASTKGNQSLLDLGIFKDYLSQLCKVYCLVFEKHLDLRITIDELFENCKIVVDDKKLKQILANLISNAIKNTSDGNMLKITIKPSSRQVQVQRERKTCLKKNLFEDSLLPSSLSQQDMKHTNLNFDEKCSRHDAPTFLNINDTAIVSRKFGDFGILSCSITPGTPFGKDCKIIITVEDTGKGIDDAIIPAINKPKSYSARREERNISDGSNSKSNNNNNILNAMSALQDNKEYGIKNGLGTGLSICKKLCAELNIEMKCELIYDLCQLEIAKISKQVNYPHSQKIIGTKFSLYLSNELENPGTLLNVTREAHDKELRVNSSEKTILKYDNESNNEISCFSRKRSLSNENDKEENLDTYCHFPQTEPKIGFNPSSLQTSSFEFSLALLRQQSTKKKMSCAETKCSTDNFFYTNNQLNATQKNSSSTTLFVFGKKDRKSSIYSRPNGINNFANTTTKSFETGDYNVYETESRYLPGQEYMNWPKAIETVISEKDEPDKSPPRHKGSISSLHGEDKHIQISNFDQELMGSTVVNPIKSEKRKRFHPDTNALETNPNRHKFMSSLLTSHRPAHRQLSKEDTHKKTSYLSGSDSDDTIRHKTMTSSHKDKILIVDDNSSNSQAIQRLVHLYYRKRNLAQEIHTKTLCDGIELLYEVYTELKTGKESTKVIFCDEMMEYMNGSAAVKILKNIFIEVKMREIPIVICSSFNDSGHKEKMKSVGIEHVYEKPLNYGNVEFILNSVLK